MRRGKSPKTFAANPHVVRALESRFADGKKYELAKDFATAEKIYREIVTGYERHRYNSAIPNAALGYTLLNQGKWKEAEPVLNKSIRQNPDLFESHVYLAALYRFTERWEECKKEAQLALKIDPKHTEPLISLADAQKETRQYALSVQNYLLALSLDNDSVAARRGLASAYMYLGDPSVALPMFRKVMEMEPGAWIEKSVMLFAMQYDSTLSNDDVLQEHLELGARIRKEVGPPQTFFPNDRDPNRKLNIGYISADFKEHVVMRFVEHVFTSHDRNRFEITLIAINSKKDKDTERIRKHADHWLDVSELTDDEAAKLVRAESLDILVDLTGHSGTPRAMLLARRLAPIQMTWCGYSGTTGLDTIDYIIVDNVIAPPGEKTFFSEKPLRLPTSYLSLEPFSRDVAPLPFEKNGYVTFGSMNNPSKMNKHVVSWWADILKAVPDSKLLMRYVLFLDPLVRERVARMFRECGIAPERYEMLPGGADLLAAYNEVDIALDTFPYNGTTTTCESLWMGVPVITLRGDRFAARVGASLLTYAGLSDFIAESPSEYVSIAVSLANSTVGLASLRRNLRAHLANTPVYNAQLFTKGLEKAYIEVFQHWCEEDIVSLPAA